MTGIDETASRPDDEHERLRLDVAGYVLGGLTTHEQGAFEGHLATCPTCQDELAELDPLPVLLDLARPEPEPSAAPSAPPTEVPSATPLARTDGVASVGPDPQPTRSSRTRRVLVGTALAVALVAGPAIGAVVTHSDGPRFSQPVALRAVGDAANASPGPSGSAAWRAIDGGTLVRLDLWGLPGDGTYYECLWISGQGVQSAGTFRPDADGNVHVDLTTAAAKYPGWRLEIRAHPPGGGSDTGVTVLDASA